MDGFRFLEEKNNLGNTTPVIVLSARTDHESINRALKLGVKDYITKPFNSSDFENKIKNFL
jgi:DNA-binding response OmpR family regulator